MASKSLNKVQLIGNLVKDPEITTTSNGTKRCFMVIATNRGWKTESGEYKEESEFHPVVAWQKLAEICEQILSKGTRVYIEGRLSTREWEEESGNKRRETEIVLEEMIALERPKSSSESSDEGMPF